MLIISTETFAHEINIPVDDNSIDVDNIKVALGIMHYCKAGTLTYGVHIVRKEE